MSQLEKLFNRYEKLEGLLDSIEAARKVVGQQEREDLQKVLEKYFTAEEGDVVECSHGGVYIRREGADKYNGFLTVYVDDTWDENDNRVYNKLTINNPSFRTDEVSEWIVERFVSQAHYTRIAVDFQDDILAEMNQVTETATQKMTDISRPAKELRKESKTIWEEMETIKKEARLKALMSEEGLEIEGEERERWGETYREFPDLQVKFDWTLRNIRGLRIDKMTASGKSADITVKMKRWDHNTQQEVLADEKIERVRMDNIDMFLRSNNIAI